MECASGCGLVGSQEPERQKVPKRWRMKIMGGESYVFRMVDSLVCLGGFLKFISSSSKKAGKQAR